MTTAAIPIRSVAASPRSRGLTVGLVSEIYLAAYFLFISGAVDFLFYGGSAAGGFENRSGSNALVQLVAISAAAPALLVCFLRSRSALRVLAQAWPYLLLLGLAGSSILWSVDPHTSIRRFLALALNLPIALYFAMAVRGRDVLRTVGIVAAVICLICLPFIATLGSLDASLHARHGAALQGIFPSKTASGVFFGVAAILLWGNSRNGARKSPGRLFWSGLTLLAFIELILSQSRTPLLAVVISGLVLWLALFVFAPHGWQARVQGALRAGLAGLTVATAAIVGPLSAALVLYLIGRDLTLTGRWNLWMYAIDKDWSHRWLGAGIKAFWTDAMTSDLIVLHAHWNVGQTSEALTSNAHNGYLDVWLELGFLGLALFALFWVSFLVKALRRIARDGVGAAWYLGIWAFMTGYYVANSTVFEHDEISWFMAVFAYVSLCAIEVRRAAGVGPAVAKRSVESARFRKPLPARAY